VPKETEKVEEPKEQKKQTELFPWESERYTEVNPYLEPYLDEERVLEMAEESFEEYIKDMPPDYITPEMEEEYMDMFIEEYYQDLMPGQYHEQYWDKDWFKPRPVGEGEVRMILHELSHYVDHLKKGEQFVKETTEYFKDKERKEIDMSKYFQSPAEQMSFITEMKYMRSKGRSDEEIVGEMLMDYGGEKTYWEELLKKVA
jgi:hypothetical protein